MTDKENNDDHIRWENRCDIGDVLWWYLFAAGKMMNLGESPEMFTYLLISRGYQWQWPPYVAKKGGSLYV